MTKTRILSLILTLSLLLSSALALVSCELEDTDNGTGKPDGTEASENGDSAEEVYPDVSRKNYGDDFFLHICPDVNPVGHYWVEESKNDILSDAIYARQQKVKEYLGVEVIGVPTGNYSQYAEPFMTSVKNKDGSVDTLISHVHSNIDGLISGNYLVDFNDVPGIDLEADYWNYDFMDEISIADKMFLGFSDFNLTYTYVVEFNKEILAKYEGNLDESVYDSVLNYRWTLDRMISLASLAYIDRTGDGKTIDDSFGLTSSVHVPFAGLIQASGLKLIEQNNSGDYEISFYNSYNQNRMVELVEKLTDLRDSDYAWLWRDHSGIEIGFTEGRSLMHLSSTYSLSGHLDSDISFGVLPYPMFDEAQGKTVGYRSLTWGGYLCVPTYTRNIQMVGDTLEMLSFFSDDVTEVFYQKILGKQVAESPLDKQMLDIIWDSVCSDYGLTYSEVMRGNGPLHVLANVTDSQNGENIASYVASRSTSVRKTFEKFIKAVSKMS